jgi:hypothetical protein
MLPVCSHSFAEGSFFKVVYDRNSSVLWLLERTFTHSFGCIELECLPAAAEAPAAATTGIPTHGVGASLMSSAGSRLERAVFALHGPLKRIVCFLEARSAIKSDSSRRGLDLPPEVHAILMYREIKPTVNQEKNEAHDFA